MEILVANSTILIGMAVIFGLFMAWGIGANDVANAMGTSVGSGALTFKQAVIIAAIFECAGAVLAGGEVTATIRKGIIDVSSLGSSPELLVYGMLASLCLLPVSGCWWRPVWVGLYPPRTPLLVLSSVSVLLVLVWKR